MPDFAEPTTRTPPRPDPAPELRQQVRAGAENRPGIYRFIGPRGELLYIGKSVRVRSRLLSYFRARRGKPLEILRVARRVEWEYVPTEFEALLKEFRLIRAFRPRFNVHHRRDRRFAWIKLTRETAPRLLATRRPIADGARYFGPFPATRALPRTVRDLAHLLGLRDCPARTPMHYSDQLDLLAPPRTPGCARAELGSCPAPCAALVSRQAYQQGVEEAEAFLAGETDEPARRVRRRIERASTDRAFEVAALWRDRLERIERLRETLVDHRRYLDSLRFVYRVPTDPGRPRGVSGDGPEARAHRVYLIIGGRVRLTFDEAPTLPGRLPPAREDRQKSRIAAALDQATGEVPLPLDEEAREELFLVARWFRRRPEELERGCPPEAYIQ
ncbi:MAG: nuclease [Gemmatimonadales bacterium]|nr:MAG: nuclease [Gemmatimonadales bacterium]